MRHSNFLEHVSATPEFQFHPSSVQRRGIAAREPMESQSLILIWFQAEKMAARELIFPIIPSHERVKRTSTDRLRAETQPAEVNKG